MQNEILKPVLDTDEVAVPRYDIVGPDGSVIQQNIELRLKNEVVQEGTPMTKENLLAGNTEATIWGDIADRTVNQALLKLALSVYAGEGMVVNVTVQNDAGEPFEGVTIGGLFDSSANTMVTDAEGKATGYTVSTSATLSVTGFFDLEDSTVTVTGDRGSTQNVTITMKRRNFLSITSTQAKMFSPFCKRVDVTAVGGGGGGGGSHANQYSYVAQGGQGGAGGNVTVKENVPFTAFTDYTATVGAGGAAGGASFNATGNGGTGGTSSFLGVSAAGGAGGVGGNQNATTNNTAGNGHGGAGAARGKGAANKLSAANSGGAGTVYGFTSFTETGLFSGGGAGGGATQNSRVDAVSGGSPYGGAGGGVTYGSGDGYALIAPTSGKGPGGGGGGAAGSYNNISGSDYTLYSGGAKGYRGVVNIRMWFEEDLAA